MVNSRVKEFSQLIAMHDIMIAGLIIAINACGSHGRMKVHNIKGIKKAYISTYTGSRCCSVALVSAFNHQFGPLGGRFSNLPPNKHLLLH
jgi:hypothetical protein